MTFMQILCCYPGCKDYYIMDEMSKHHTILNVVFEKLYVHTCNYQVMNEFCYFACHVWVPML